MEAARALPAESAARSLTVIPSECPHGIPIERQCPECVLDAWAEVLPTRPANHPTRDERELRAEMRAEDRAEARELDRVDRLDDDRDWHYPRW